MLEQEKEEHLGIRSPVRAICPKSVVFMDARYASKILGITLPTSLNALKTQFHRRCLEEHPDVSKHPEAGKRFQDLRTAYEFLRAHPSSIELVEEDLQKLSTVCGVLLSNLGKGLDQKTNSKTCNDCSGKGYATYYEKTADCPDCRLYSRGVICWGVEYRCGACKGSGLSRRSRKGKDCAACQGTGWRRTRHRSSTCRTCKGALYVENVKTRQFVKCAQCNGSGELAIFNPVLPKGLLSSR